MKKILLLLFTLFLCHGVLFAQKEERKNIRTGNKLLLKEELNDAEIAYRKSLDVNPRSIEGNYNLGNVLFKQEKYPEAAQQYELLAGQGQQMISEKGGQDRLAEVFHNMGNIGMKEKDYAKSVELYKQSLRLNPNDEETRYNLALAQKLLENQQNEDQGQDNQEDKQDDQDQNQDQQQQQQNQDNQKENKTQEEQQQNEQMSQNNAQQILDAFLQDEKDTQEKVKKAQQQQQQRRRTEKEW